MISLNTSTEEDNPTSYGSGEVIDLHFSEAVCD